MLIALASLHIKWRDKSYNFKKCEALIQRAKAKNVELIIFPEMSLTGFSVIDPLSEHAENSWTIKNFSKLAKKHKLSIQFGLSLFGNKNSSYNAMISIDQFGKLISRYNKVNLFSFSEENKEFLPGQKPIISDLGSIKIGNSICYDLRFPELYRQYANNCHCIVNIANWPSSRIRDWRYLLIARAIENQCIMIGVNRQGIDGLNLKYTKSSYIFLPSGKQLKPIYNSIELDCYDVDRSIVDRYRVKLPFLKDMANTKFLNIKV
jgi:omega-amidase